MLNQFNKGTGVSLWSAAFCVALLWGCGGSSEPSESGGPDDSADIDDTERDDGDETSSTNTESDAEVDDSTDAVEDDTDDTVSNPSDSSEDLSDVQEQKTHVPPKHKKIEESKETCRKQRQ